MFFIKIKAIIKIISECIFDKNLFTYSILNRVFEKDLNNIYKNHEDLRKFAIVMQGPWIAEEQFTLETLKIYRQILPHETIIFSSTSILKKNEQILLSSLDIIYLFNDFPPNAGVSNSNFQIITSFNGIKEAKKLGSEYILKTRSDQRITNDYFRDFLFNLIDTFALETKSSKQKFRLVGFSLNTFKLRPYGLSDMFMFGHIDDMINYWCLSYDKRSNLDVKLEEGSTYKDFALNEICEVRFCTQYLRYLGLRLNFSISDSMKAFGKYFIIIDQHALGIIWPKYSLNQNPYKNFGKHPEISFNDWLMLYTKGDNLEYNEDLLNKKIGK